MTPNRHEKKESVGPTDEKKAEWKEFLKEHKFSRGKISDDQLAMHELDGQFFPAVLVQSVLHRKDMEPALKELLSLFLEAGYTLDDLPALMPRALYPSTIGVFIANTAGLRESDWDEAQVLGAQDVADLRKRYPDGQISVRLVVVDTRITRAHETMGAGSSEADEKAEIPRFFHVIFEYGVLQKDGTFDCLFSQESSGFTNHYRAGEYPYAYQSDGKKTATAFVPVRDASKDGKIDHRGLIPYMPSIHGDTLNGTYAVKGKGTNVPPGLEYGTRISINVKLGEEGAKKAFAQARLFEKGGIVLLEDEPIDNPNEKFASEHPKVPKVISLGSGSQHAQHFWMCAQVGLLQTFGGEDGLAFADDGWPFNVEFNAPSNTYDTMQSLIFYAMSGDTKNVTLHYPDGRPVPPDEYEALLGDRTIERWRFDAISARGELKARQARENAEPIEEKEQDDKVFMAGPGTTVVLDLGKFPEGHGRPDKETLRSLFFDRNDKDVRYTAGQQFADAGWLIHLRAPLLQEQVTCFRAWVIEACKRFDRVPVEKLKRVFDKMPQATNHSTGQ